MNQITIRNITPEIERVILAESKSAQLSLNKTIINMLKRATTKMETNMIKTDKDSHHFDRFFNTWTKEEGAEFDAFIEEAFEQIDEAMWK